MDPAHENVVYVCVLSAENIRWTVLGEANGGPTSALDYCPHLALLHLVQDTSP